jgi:tellurite resistance protein
VPAGETVSIAGREIRGMVYFGTGLRPVSGYCGDIEPALIDPHRKVSSSRVDHSGQLMSYWPSYSGIDPASRAAYLHWLAQGRQDSGAYIGYVFLFFYGIERRVLVDAQDSEQAKGEIDGLLAEVERLLQIYGGNNSFRGYARSFLAVARLLHRPIDPSTLQPPRSREGWEIPLPVKIALGAFAAEEKPIPPEWAYTWAVCSPEVRLRTPAQRCPGEFEELFKIRYAEAFDGGGLEVKPNKTRISAEYHPASSSFFDSISLTLKSLPDVTGLAGPVRKLQEIVDRTQQDLDVYSRWLGRTGESRSLAAVALLPPELARGRESEEIRLFVDWIQGVLAGGDFAVVSGAELMARWPCQVEGKLSRRDAEMLAGFLGQRGYGLEPDVRFGGPPPGSGPSVLFRLSPEGSPEPGATYHAAAVLLHLAVTVSAADGVVSETEERHLLAHLESALHLSPAERARLKAHLRWLVASPPGLTGLKKRIEPLGEPQRREIGQFLVTVAGADGHVGAEELKLLSRIYPLLGLEAQAVYSDVHALASAEAPPAAEPVTVRPASPAPAGFPIPPQKAARPESGVTLDLKKVQAKLAETEAIAGVLEGIFSEEETPARAAVPQPALPVAEGPPPLAGLDQPHSALLRRLAEKTSWERMELERLAGDLGLLPDGALEIINESAFERCGAPLVEGDETLEIDAQVLEEMLA